MLPAKTHAHAHTHSTGAVPPVCLSLCLSCSVCPAPFFPAHTSSLFAACNPLFSLLISFHHPSPPDCRPIPFSIRPRSSHLRLIQTQPDPGHPLIISYSSSFWRPAHLFPGRPHLVPLPCHHRSEQSNLSTNKPSLLSSFHTDQGQDPVNVKRVFHYTPEDISPSYSIKHSTAAPPSHFVPL